MGGGMWIPVPFDPTETRKEPYEKIGHRFAPLKGFHKPVCQGCGVIFATNPLTEWIVKVGCDWKNHPQHRQKVRSLCSGFR